MSEPGAMQSGELFCTSGLPSWNRGSARIMAMDSGKVELSNVTKWIDVHKVGV